MGNRTIKSVGAACSGMMAMIAAACAGAPEAPPEREGAPGAATEALSQTCVTIQRTGSAGQVADTKLRSDEPTTNAGARTTFVTGNAATRTCLVQFDLSSIPANATIDSATVTLWDWINLGSGAVDAHRVTAAWSEGTVTWNSFQNAYDPAIAASFSNGSAGSAVSFDLTTLVQSWYAGAPNNGIALTSTADTTWRSSEWTTVSERPSIRVCYTPLVCPGAPDGTPCDDGDACTNVDTCQNGVCTGKNAVTFTQMESHARFTCGVAPSGDAYCWGREGSGELGNGDLATRRAYPTLVSGGITFAQVSSAGDYSATYMHACGITPAGAAYCWGDNTFGQLGDGTTQSTTVPVPVTGGHVFTAISAGPLFTCGLTSSGAAWCWGDNTRGQLGTGSFGGKSQVPVAVQGATFSSIAAGGAYYPFACGVTLAGQAVCWGNNAWGTLGTGTHNDAATPVPIASASTFSQVSAGNYHACGLATNGDVYCWGNGTSGTLGTMTLPDTCIFGPNTCSLNPMLIPGGITFTSVSSGASHVCGRAANGNAYCWGDGTDGALGDGTHTSRPTPAPVAGGHLFSSVQAGVFHTCGIAQDGAAWCWGYDGDGALGRGNFGGNSAVPVAVLATSDLACTGDACHSPGTCAPATGVCSMPLNGACP